MKSATPKQKLAVLKTIEARGRKTKGQILLESGYSESISRAPSLIYDSRGFREELAQYGLTEGLVTKALVEDIIAKPKRRFFELSLGADILGMKRKEAPADNRTLIINISDEKAKRILSR